MSLKFLVAGIATLAAPVLFAADLYVSATAGQDTNAGTESAPFRTLQRAKAEVRARLSTATEPLNVWVSGGTYRLSAPLVFEPADSGTSAAPVKYAAAAGENVILSGAIALAPTNWTLLADGVQVADVGTNLRFDLLFVNGGLQVMARYPNYDAATAILDGYAADALSSARAANWANPSTGFVRSLHNDMWGGNSFKITGKDGSGNPLRQWVGDNNRGSGIHASYRMVENIREELDARGEWFYDAPAGKLYFYPPAGLDLASATFEGASQEELIKVVGTASTKVKHLTFDRLTFTGTHRTLFTGTYEPLLRGDWCVVRKGAVFLQDAENVTVSNSKFDRVGGNAVFISGYNRYHLITNNEFLDNGATCVNVVGLPAAVRYPSYWPHALYPDLPVHRTDIQDTTPGPLTDDYPKDITISYNYMFNMGRFEKQVCGVNLSMAESITVSHNTIHRSPRSGVNVNDGTWGGHIFEYNDIYDCVRESGDHGPFNSWGRDRFWSYTGFNTNGANGTAKQPYAFLDAWKPVIIRNNRFHYATVKTWGIDLDDGSSNYEIYNNLCLNTGFKLREGFGRKVYNNIFVNERGNLHVWYDGARDDIQRNIIVNGSPWSFAGLNSGNMAAKQPTIDYNLFWNGSNNNTVNPGFSGWKDLGLDVHSVSGNPLFTNPSALDYTVQAGSPALALGFVNFPMNQFGRPGAPAPAPISTSGGNAETADPEPLMGATITSIYSETIKSATGIGDSNGIYFQTVPTGSYAAGQGFLANDVVRSIGGTPITTKLSFWAAYNAIAPGTSVTLTLRRNQTDQSFTFVKMSGTEKLNETAGVVFTGSSWFLQVNGNCYNGDLRAATVNNDSFTFTFNGTGIDWLSQKNSDQGNVDVYIDDVLDQTISCYNATRLYQQVVYSKRGLSPGLHTVRAVKRSAGYLILDGQIVYSSAPPAAPDGLAATVLSGSQIRLNWTDRATDETGYTVERSPAGANTWSVLTAALPAGTTTFTDGGLSAQTSYDFRVKADGPGGSSAYAGVTATTGPNTSATQTWSGGGSDGNWQTATNWSAQPAAGNALAFSGSVQLASTNDFPANTVFAGITFASGAGAFVLGGNAIGLNGGITNSATSLQTINLGLLLANANTTINADSGDITIGGVITDGANTYGLTKTGPRALILTAANTFDGGVTLKAGTLAVGNNAALGTGALTSQGGTLIGTSAGTRTLTNALHFAAGTTILTTAGRDLILNGAWSGAGIISTGEGFSSSTPASVQSTSNLAEFTGTFRYFGQPSVNVIFNAAVNTPARIVLSGSTTGQTLRFAGASTIGELSGTGGRLTGQGGNSIIKINQATDTSFGGLIDNVGGATGLEKAGSGMLNLTAANAYTLGTTVSGGTLLVSNASGSALGSGAVSVLAGATLGGSGRISGATTLSSGAALAPGVGGVGSLTLGTLTLAGGSMLRMELAQPAASDRLVLTGAFAASGTVTIDVAALTGFGLGTYPLLTGATGISATNFALANLPAGYTGNLSVTGDTLNLLVTDTTPPVLTMPGSITVPAASPAGAVVTFTVTASDALSGPVNPVASPASGSTFPPGVTTVQCIATDPSGNQAVASFTVTVTNTSASLSTANPVVVVDGEDAEISVQALPGNSYQLQRSFTLASESWINVGPPRAGTGVLRFSDQPGSQQPKVFYRFQVAP